jgi:MerR family transcriptional regulator, light-induced transcriptional regulator
LDATAPDDPDVIVDDQAFGGPAGCALTIRQASSLLTVPVSTLRSWERRYDVPMTARTTGGHRRYTKLAIDELRLMRDEIARGKRAGEAAVSARLLLQPAEPARPFIDAFLSAAQAMQPTQVRVALDNAYRELGLGMTIDEVLMSAMRRIGRWWETGRCDVGHEHVATEAARTWLGKIVAFAPEPRRLAPVVLACGPHDTHTMGLEALGALLSYSGRPCCVLGARTPIEALISTVGRVEPAAVVVVSHLSLGRRLATEAVRLVAGLGVPTFYAGNAFISASTRRRMPGRYLGDSLRDAAHFVETALVR